MQNLERRIDNFTDKIISKFSDIKKVEEKHRLDIKDSLDFFSLGEMSKEDLRKVEKDIEKRILEKTGVNVSIKIRYRSDPFYRSFPVFEKDCDKDMLFFHN